MDKDNDYLFMYLTGSSFDGAIDESNPYNQQENEYLKNDTKY